MQCQQEGCSAEGWYCEPPGKDAPDEWYCPKHANQNGYCSACGGFFAGIESFEFRPDGLCDNCHDDAAKGDWDEDDNDLDDWIEEL